MADAGISFRQQNVFWGDNTRDSGRDFAGSFFGDHAKGDMSFTLSLTVTCGEKVLFIFS